MDTESSLTDDPFEHVTPAPAELGSPRRQGLLARIRRVDRSVIVVSVILGAGLFLVVRGIAAGVTGDERTNYPDQIESVDPVPEAVQILSQTGLFVDLIDGYTGVLIVDGVELPTVDIGRIVAAPGQQPVIPPGAVFEQGNDTLTFTPGDGQIFDEFTSGVHAVQVVYWTITDGRERARSYTWTFNVV